MKGVKMESLMLRLQNMQWTIFWNKRGGLHSTCFCRFVLVAADGDEKGIRTVNVIDFEQKLDFVIRTLSGKLVHGIDEFLQ